MTRREDRQTGPPPQERQPLAQSPSDGARQNAKWIKTAATLYGKQVKLWYQTIDALWYPSAGQQLLRIVVVRDPGAAAAMIASSPSISLSAPRKSWRSSRDVGPWKFASATSSNFWASKILRTGWRRQPHAPPPLIFYIYDLVLLWHAQSGTSPGAEVSPRHRICGIRKITSVSFEDIAQNVTSRHLAGKDFQRPRSGCADAKNTSTLCGMGEGTGVNLQNSRLG